MRRLRSTWPGTRCGRGSAMTEGTLKPWLFPQTPGDQPGWMAECLSTPGTYPGDPLWRGPADLAVERIHRACVDGCRGVEELRPILDPYNETGSSRLVRFQTTKTNLYATRADKCQIDRIVRRLRTGKGRRRSSPGGDAGSPPLRAEREAGLRSAVRGRRPRSIAIDRTSSPWWTTVTARTTRCIWSWRRRASKGRDDAKHDTMRRAVGAFGQCAGALWPGWSFIEMEEPYGMAEKISK